MTWEQAKTTGVSYSRWLTRFDPGDADAPKGSAGVREPRKPRPQSDAGGAALDLPPAADPAPPYQMTIGGRL